ncbi:MAG: hypothetical protein KKB21_01170 [Nanoarchaeota archaeon]|nr:hypothetical protein [Nanoarchaeota archaeon]MBU4086167.1 hypothetical protein [Nanoarchaeota archaeon]
MKKITLWLVIGISLVLLLIIAAFLFLVLVKPKYGKGDVEKPVYNSDPGEFVLQAGHVNYLLNEIGAYQLHTQPMSSENPLIELRSDDSAFFSEIEKGKIITRDEKTYEPDIIISTTKQEVINALESSNVKEYMKNSVSSGNTGIELVSSYSELFFKGYLQIYKDLTGKSFTGSVIRIFAN